MPKATFFNLPDDKRQQVIDAAIDEFAQQGYEAASISRLVVQAGIAKGSFYQYFEDKADLFHYLLEVAGEEKAQFLAAPPQTDLPPFDYLRWLLRGNVHFEVSNPQLAKLAASAMAGDAPGGSDFQRQIQAASDRFYRELLERGVQSGQLDPDLNIDMATFIFSVTSIKIAQYILANVDIQPDELVYGTQHTRHTDAIEAIYDAFLHILEHGMGKR